MAISTIGMLARQQHPYHRNDKFDEEEEQKLLYSYHAARAASSYNIPRRPGIHAAVATAHHGNGEPSLEVAPTLQLSDAAASWPSYQEEKWDYRVDSAGRAYWYDTSTGDTRWATGDPSTLWQSSEVLSGSDRGMVRWLA